MKIDKIEAKNFKNFEEFEFEPKKTTTVVVGNNGQGKTTFTQVLRYGLTGDLPDNPIKEGKDNLSVKLSFTDADGRVQGWERRKSLSKPLQVKVNGANTTAKSLASYIESISGIPFNSLKLASSSELIDNLSPAEFSDFVMSYIPEELTLATIESYIDSTTPGLIAFLESKGVFPEKDKFGYNRLQEVYNYFYEERKNKSSVLKLYKAKVEGVVMEKPEFTLEDIDKQLENVLKEEGGFANALMAIEAYNKAVEARKKQDETIANITAELSKITVGRPDPNKKLEIEAKKRELNNSIVTLKASVSTLRTNSDVFKTTIENLDKPTCPLSEGLICKTDKSSKKQEFLDKIEENNKSIEGLLNEIELKKTELEGWLKKEADLQSQTVLYQKMIALKGQLEEYKKSLIKLPVKPAAVTKTMDFDEEKKRLRALRQKVADYDQFVKDAAKFNQLNSEYMLLDELVGMFAPKGTVTQKITNYYFEVFEDIVNDMASKVSPDLKIKFKSEDGIKVYCSPKKGADYVPYQCCSSGERAVVVFLLTDLISSALSKANILILDDLDKLDENAFERLMSCVMQPDVQKAYDHIILCAVDHADTLATLDKYKADIDILKV